MPLLNRQRPRCALLAAVALAAVGAPAQTPFSPYAEVASAAGWLDPASPVAASLPPPAESAPINPAEVIDAAASPVLTDPSTAAVPPPPAEAAPAEVVPAEAAPAEPSPAEVVEAIIEAPEIETPEAVPAPAPEEAIGSPWWSPYAWLDVPRWETAFEFGLNGAAGTSDSLSFRTGGYVKRETSGYKFDSSLYYNKTSAEGVEVQSNALLDTRYDFLFGDSPWTLFLASQTFFDEFQAFDLNVNATTGVGYQWIDEEWLKLTTSFGSGASREFGDAVDDEWVPEAIFGVNFEQKLDDDRRFYAKADYFPRWEDLSVYRIVADIGLEIDLPRPSDITLKVSATDRFDSEPGGVEPHNFNYAISLLWKL